MPGKPRATLRDDSAGFEIVIPAKRNIFLTIFLGIWLVFWAFGWVAAFSQIASGQGGAGADAFMLVWITGWTLGGAFACAVLAWSIAGRERILLTPSTLRISRKAFNVGRTKEYDVCHIAKLRVSPEPYNPFDFRSSMRFFGIGGGHLAFDYGASTIRFGSAVDEGEAHMLCSELLNRNSALGEPAA
jgi:hypothetical protein